MAKGEMNPMTQTQEIITRIDERTNAIAIALSELKATILLQNNKLYEHESRLSIVEQKARTNEVRGIDNRDYVNKICVGFGLAMVTGFILIITNLVGVW